MSDDQKGGQEQDQAAAKRIYQLIEVIQMGGDGAFVHMGIFQFLGGQAGFFLKPG